MNDLIVLRDLLAGAEVPNGVLTVTYDDIGGRWEIHMREEDFRAAFKVFNHVYHSRFKVSDTYRIETLSQGVRFYAITDQRPETDAGVIASECPRQAYLAEVREEALAGDLVANARRAR